MKKMGLESTVHYVHETLPYKYKNPVLRRGDDTSYGVVEPRNNSSKKLSPEKANVNYIEFLSELIEVYKKTKKSMEKKIVIEPHIPEAEFQEELLRGRYLIRRLDEILDGREKVPPTTMHILLYCLATATLSDTYSKYIYLRKEEAPLTPKQTGKIIKGRVTKMPRLFEPKNHQQALSMGFYGQQCEECGWWRTERKLNPNVDKFQLYCFYCRQWSKVKTMKIEVKT